MIKCNRRTIHMTSDEAFAGYQVGRWTMARDFWMQNARTSPKALRAMQVSFARNAHREAMKYLKHVPVRARA